jgi:roadblock/LC7 domain-containing protein
MIYIPSIPTIGEYGGVGKRGRFDPDAKAYIDAIVADGATVSADQEKAINTFYKTGKSEGWYSSLKRIYLPIWAVAAANARCMVSGTSGTFVGGITHTAGYVTTDGTTGHFLSDVSPGGAGCTLNGTGIFALITAASALLLTNIRRYFGAQSSSSLTRCFLSGNHATSRFGSFGINNVVFLTEFSAGDQRGVQFLGRNTSLSRFLILRASSLLSNSQSSFSSEINSTTPMCWLAGNNNGVIANYTANTARLGAAGMTDGMAQADAEAFTDGLKTLWETCTGLALP